MTVAIPAFCRHPMAEGTFMTGSINKRLSAEQQCCRFQGDMKMTSENKTAWPADDAPMFEATP